MAEELKNKPTINSLEFKGADGPVTINAIQEDNTRLNSIDDEQETLMKKQGYAMVGSKGHSFPMIEKDPVEIQKEKMMKAEGIQPPTVNRAGVPEKTLVNNPNVNQPMNKVSANQFSREQMFGKMAMDPGQKFEQPEATTTPPAPMFPNQQGSFAAYDNPMRIDEKLDEQADSIMNVGDAISDASKDVVEEGMSMYSGPGSQETPKLGRMSMNMYDGLSKSLVGDQDELPQHLQKAILDSPGMHHGKAPAKFSMSKPAEKIEYIQSSSASPLGMHGKFNHAHTKITKGNVNSAMKDDAAHISYLKRDINYDNRHGGSDKQMTADEKHISKLAGDIKYDVKKKRKYDNV